MKCRQTTDCSRLTERKTVGDTSLIRYDQSLDSYSSTICHRQKSGHSVSQVIGQSNNAIYENANKFFELNTYWRNRIIFSSGIVIVPFQINKRVLSSRSLIITLNITMSLNKTPKTWNSRPYRRFCEPSIIITDVYQKLTIKIVMWESSTKGNIDKQNTIILSRS